MPGPLAPPLPEGRFQEEMIYFVPSDAKLEPSSPALAQIGPVGTFAASERELMGSCWAQHEKPNAKTI